MESNINIVLVLRSGGDFAFRDVELITRHILGKWQSSSKPNIILLWDKASEEYNLGNIQVLPLNNTYRGTWSRMMLYSPEMEKYRPFLYIDLDTAIIQSLEDIIALIPDPNLFITLEDFWQRGRLATGLAWIPAGSKKVSAIWKAWQETNKSDSDFRMDNFLRKVVTADLFFQQFTTKIYDFKPQSGTFLSSVPEDAILVCFHGKPRIFQIAEASMSLDWVKNYIDTDFEGTKARKRVTVIIPYKTDRGWLKDAINSVDQNQAQLLLSKGDANWPTNFNNVLHLAEGEYIRYLHEDDMLTPNCIQDSVRAIEEQKVDFIHGNALEIHMVKRTNTIYKPAYPEPTLDQLLKKNYIHSATLMYRRAIFERLGGFDETLNVMEEYEFSLRCLKAGYKLGYIDSTLAIYRRHPLQKVKIVSSAEKVKEKALVNKRYVNE